VTFPTISLVRRSILIRIPPLPRLPDRSTSRGPDGNALEGMRIDSARPHQANDGSALIGSTVHVAE